MKDILGRALLDYFHGNYTEDLITETNISEEDELPLPYLFRNFSEMPLIEQKALQLSMGKILDVGCGAGSHTLYLQEKAYDVTAIDISKGAIEVCKLRGVKNALVQNVLNLEDGQYDTILVLMNGTGIFQKLEYVSKYLQKLKALLNTNGQILIDSSDLKYMFDAVEDGGIWVPQDRYYGELDFTIKYKGDKTQSSWLYMDQQIFKTACEAQNLNFELIVDGENYDYLARLSSVVDTP